MPERIILTSTAPGPILGYRDLQPAGTVQVPGPALKIRQITRALFLFFRIGARTSIHTFM